MSAKRHPRKVLAIQEVPLYFDSPALREAAGLTGTAAMLRLLTRTTPKAVSDRRSGPRYTPAKGFVTIRWELAPGVLSAGGGMIENISEGGLLVRFFGPIPPRGHFVHLQVSTPTGGVSAIAEVLHPQEDGAVRLRFEGGCTERFFIATVYEGETE